MNPKKSQPPVPSTSEKRLNTLMGQCLAAAATASMAAACSGAPVRPEGREPCPREVVRAMKENGLIVNQYADVLLDASTADVVEAQMSEGTPPPTGTLNKVWENGPIVSRVLSARKSGAPKGTLLYGYIWVDADPDLAIIHYTEAVFPNGRKVPICMIGTDVRGSEGYRRGIWKWKGSSRNAALLSHGYAGAFVDIYP